MVKNVQDVGAFSIELKLVKYFVKDVMSLPMIHSEKILKFLLVFLVILFLIFLDQQSKSFFEANKVLYYNGINIFSWLNLVYVENKGISFGLLSNLNISFI